MLYLQLQLLFATAMRLGTNINAEVVSQTYQIHKKFGLWKLATATTMNWNSIVTERLLAGT
jgi:hypothetical protein